MKSNTIYKIVTTIFLSVSVIFSFACQKQSAENSNTATAEKSNTPIETANTVKTLKPESPTEAYKMLYEAVKAKDTAKIKQLVTKSTEGMAQFMAQTYKQSIEKSYENGFTSTTFAPTLPEIRDERIKENFGALEVYSQKDNRWEDLPFMFEDGGWRLAVGDAYQGKYQLPSKGKAQKEMEASNKTIPMTNSNKIIGMPPANSPKQ